MTRPGWEAKEKRYCRSNEGQGKEARESLLRSKRTITIFGEKESVLKQKEFSEAKCLEEWGFASARRMLIALQRRAGVSHADGE